MTCASSFATCCSSSTTARTLGSSAPSSLGLLALHWLVQGYGYEITSADVWDAYRATLAAAERHGTTAEVKERVRKMVAAEGAGDRFVTKVLGRDLGL